MCLILPFQSGADTNKPRNELFDTRFHGGLLPKSTLTLNEKTIAPWILLPVVKVGGEKTYTSPLIQAMKDLLKQNKKAMVMLIDTFSRNSNVIESQKEVIAFAAENDLDIIDITMPGKVTIQQLRSIAMKSLYYKSFYKTDVGAFVDVDAGMELPQMNLGNKTLTEYIRSRGVNDLFIFGDADGCCVKETVKEALDRNFEVYVDRRLNDQYTHDAEYDEFKDRPNFHVPVSKTESGRKCTIL